jgi:hypothetical protein
VGRLRHIPQRRSHPPQPQRRGPLPPRRLTRLGRNCPSCGYKPMALAVRD